MKMITAGLLCFISLQTFSQNDGRYSSLQRKHHVEGHMGYLVEPKIGAVYKHFFSDSICWRIGVDYGTRSHLLSNEKHEFLEVLGSQVHYRYWSNWSQYVDFNLGLEKNFEQSSHRRNYVGGALVIGYEREHEDYWRTTRRIDTLNPGPQKVHSWVTAYAPAGERDRVHLRLGVLGFVGKKWRLMDKLYVGGQVSWGAVMTFHQYTTLHRDDDVILDTAPPRNEIDWDFYPSLEANITYAM